MDPEWARRMDASIEAQLLVSKSKKNKGKDKVQPSTFVAAKASARDNLSYFPLHILYYGQLSGMCP